MVLCETFAGIKDCIITTIVLCNPDTGSKVTTHAIWDTGATISAVTQKVSAELSLEPISFVRSRGVFGERTVKVFRTQLSFEHTDTVLETLMIGCDELSADPTEDIGALIGMDVIRQGDFVISNFADATTMCFRLPSMEQIVLKDVITNK